MVSGPVQAGTLTGNPGMWRCALVHQASVHLIRFHEKWKNCAFCADTILSVFNSTVH